MRLTVFTFISIMAFLGSLGFITSCSSENDNPDTDQKLIASERKSIQMTAQTRATAENLKNFYTSFTAEAVKNALESDSQDKNIIISPLSVSMMLGMVANGVDQEVQQEIDSYLGCENLSTLNSLCAQFIEELPLADELSSCSIANSFWINNPLTAKQEFQSLLTDYYTAGIHNENFSGQESETVKKINSWCHNHTNGQIPNIIDHINPLTAAIALNSIYFNSPWSANLFTKKNTKKDSFKGENGNKTVDMMVSEPSVLSCCENDNFEAVFLEFGNSAFGMWVVMPKPGIPTINVVDILAKKNLDVLNESSFKDTFIVEFPKINLVSSLSLNSILKRSGLSKISGVITATFANEEFEAFLDMQHATSLKLDEKGAEIASASKGDFIFGFGGSDSENPSVFKVNRPFFFFITEFSTNACILSGYISEP